jgi:hypothetical protein
MARIQLQRTSAETTAAICARYQLGDEAKKLLAEGRVDPEATPGGFLDALVAAQAWLDALRFLAYALPRPEAVGWACTCVREVAASGEDLPGTRAAEAWLRDPSDENRRAAMAVAENLEFAGPDAWAAVAAFWADGSMAPPDAPAVPPGEEFTGHAAAGAVMLAAVRSEPEKAAEKQRRFVALGVEIANGARPWQVAGGGA